MYLKNRLAITFLMAKLLSRCVVHKYTKGEWRMAKRVRPRPIRAGLWG
jgi:hypothetical protein